MAQTTHWARVAKNTFYSNRHRLRLPTKPATTLAIARGHSLLRKPAYLVWTQEADGEVVSVVAIDKKRERAAILYPAYDQTCAIAGRRYRIWCPTEAADIRAAMMLMQEEHPKGANHKGTLVCLAEVRSGARAMLLGVALIGEILHTNLIERRAFADAILGTGWLKQIKQGKLSRGQIIHRLNLTGGKRFVIRSGHRSKGLGAALADNVARIGAAYRWPPADFVEVSRRMGEKTLYSLCKKNGRDFLTRSSYVPVPSWRWSVPIGSRDERSTIASSTRTIPGYYYRRVAPFRRKERAISRAMHALL